MTPEQCIAYYDTIPVDCIFNLVYPIREDETKVVNRKFHPFIQAFDPLDPRMMPAYERLAAWRRPVVFHTGYEEFYGLSLPPETMEEIARLFPTLPVACGSR